MGSIVFIILWIVGLFILYRIILVAVREGINESVVGKLIKKNEDPKNDQETFQPYEDFDKD
ncbi:hypothetical protein ACFSMW_13575 [Virgibacillus halophilus]|uniref:hypothetical protein n=1 Tax=Tigheibacillus halophilus TaxID=361280 RepID=UPI003633BEE1